MRARVLVAGTEREVDLSQPVSLAAAVDFSGGGARLFGAPPPSERPLSVDGFNGRVIAGASCNCSTVSLTPHCDGTHTECAAHLTEDRLDAYRVVPPGLLAARLLTVTAINAQAAAAASEGTDPAPQASDSLITRLALAASSAATHGLDGAVRALIIRTLPESAASRSGDRGVQVPAYLSREAAQWLVDRGIEHLVIDLPSIDRTADEGRLTAHRIFFGLPPAARRLPLATRAQCTVTELARVPRDLSDGSYLLELQVPAIPGDAVPSRPLLFRLLPP